MKFPRAMRRLAAWGGSLVFAALGTGAAVQAAPPAGPQTAVQIMGQASAPRQLMRAYFTDIRQARAIAHSKFETLESKYELGYVMVLANPAEQRELRALGLRLEKDEQWAAQQQAQALNEAQVQAQSRRLSGQAATLLAGIPNYSCYPTVEEVFSAADALVAAKPTLASWIDIGDSWDKANGFGGYDLKVLKLTNSATAGSKPILFIQAGIHAREYTTTPLTLEFAKKLVNGYGVDADMTWILDHHEVHLLLVTNPDGRKKAETGLLWRKNANRNYCGASSNSRGADLNRNFGFGWNSTNGAGSSGDACAETYRGPSASSEPEVKAIEAYVRRIWPDRRGPNRGDGAPADTNGIHLDIHSHGRLLLWPWGTNGAVSANDTQFATLGRKFAYWNGHTPERSLSLYETDGTSDGPSYGELGVAAFTFELGTAFFEQCSYYTSTLLPGNLPALVYAAKVVRAPYVTPAGPDVTALSAGGNASSSGVPAGTTVTVSATLDDTRYSNVNGTEPTQNIAAAEYYVDLPPWQAGAVAKPMSASDGGFNAKQENASASLNTTGWSNGRHLVYVRGQDAAGNWGALSAVFVVINPGGSTQPVAAFAASVNGLQASFTDQSTASSAITARSWNFGDGGSSTLTNPSHSYASGGNYTVTLNITDSAGQSASANKTVTVADDGVPLLANGQSVSGLAGAAKSWKYYKVNVPAGASNLLIKTSGGTGDVDLYTQLGAKPTASAYNCSKASSSMNEACSFAAPASGTTYIGLLAYAAYSGGTLTVSFTAP